MDPIWKQAGVQESSSPLLANLDLMQTGSGKFTWKAALNEGRHMKTCEFLEESAAQVLCTEARSAFQLMSRNMFGCCAK